MRARRAVVHLGAHPDACMHDVGLRSRGHDTPRFCVRSWSCAAAPAPPHSCRQGGALGARIRTLIAQRAGQPPRSTGPTECTGLGSSGRRGPLGAGIGALQFDSRHQRGTT